MARQTINLSGNQWQMERMRPGQGEAEKFHLLPPEFQGTTFSWNHASVPGDVYTDLWKAGEIDDPYFGRNMHKAKWVMDYEWWYLRRFDVDASAKGKNIRLNFAGVDYNCDVWLNGHYLGNHEGMFSDFHFDVSNIISFDVSARDGSNIVVVRINPPPKNFRNCGGKKVNFSGDYFTGVVPFGIWRPITLEITEKNRINSCQTDFELAGEDVIAHLAFEVENLTKKPQELSLDVQFTPHNFKSQVTYQKTFKIMAQPGVHNYPATFQLTKPELWWPYEMGKQNLYDFQVTLLHNAVSQDTFQATLGVREVTMAMNPGFTPEESEFPWTFLINKKHLFLRSACWGGQPSFFYGRNNLKKYEKRLQMVKEANINNLRIFGWHAPEIPDFYRLCDELGITVWTNFSLATQAYPDDPQFFKEVLHECTAVVKERRNHPSQIYWMGGEEVFFSEAHEKSGNKKLMEAIGKAVAKCTTIPYGIASPLSSASALRLGFKPKESQHANGHYYQEHGQQYMEEYYPSLDCAVVPELTAASAPSVKSLKKFIPADELWPLGVSWGYHWGDIDFLKDINYEVFGSQKMGSLEEFVEATQIAQGTVFQYALETYRRRKPKVSAVALCHFITHWPDIKWGIIDYYGDKKLSFAFVKQSYQLLLPSVAFTRRRWKPGETFTSELWIVNDLHQSYEDVTYEWSVEYKGKRVAGSKLTHLNVQPDSSAKFGKAEWELPKTAKGDFTVRVSLSKNGKVLATNNYVLLVGDQEAAKAQSLRYHLDNEAKKAKYGPSIYRYWPERWDLD